ncbi:MAG: RluA family pseudouridine synthase [Bacilli bacterium]
MVGLKVKNNLVILYEDNHIIVVVKPCNILSQSDNTMDSDLLTVIKQYLKDKYHKEGNVFLGLVHRLDRPVSGVMVFAKTSKAASRLSQSIRDGLFEKKYLAVINGILDNKEGELVNYIKKNNDNTSVISTVDNGKLAILNYKVLEEVNNLSLVDISLITGRHHQIRVQFANINHPLYGDQRYGKMDKKQIALHAYSLSFPHPITKEILTFINMPSSTIWFTFNYVNKI